MTADLAQPLRDLQVHRIPLADLTLFPGNARRGDVDKIARSLALNGQYRPIIVRRETNEILAGNHTYQAAQQLGWETVLVTYLDGLTESAARKIVLVDNKSNDAAGYDEHALAELLASLEGDYDGSGFDSHAEIAELLALLDDEPAAETDPDDIPSPPDYEPITKTGDTWKLGDHLLVVGDSTDQATVKNACGGGACGSGPHGSALQRGLPRRHQGRPDHRQRLHGLERVRILPPRGLHGGERIDESRRRGLRLLRLGRDPELPKRVH
jgi:hypothetical protein